MRRLFATLVVMWAGTLAVAQEAVTRPTATGPVTTAAATAPVTRPATTTATVPSSGPSAGPATTRGSTQPATNQAEREARRRERDEQRAADTRRRDAAAKLSGMLSTIALDAEKATSEINSIASKASTDKITYTVDSELYGLLADIRPRLAENDRLLTPAPTLDTLRTLEMQWGEDARTLDGWTDDLRRRSDFLRGTIQRLDALTNDWRQRRRAVVDARNVQDETKFSTSDLDELSQRIEAVRNLTRPLLDTLNWEQNRANSLVVTMSAAQFRVRDALSAVRDAQRKAQDRLLAQDSPPLWNALLNAKGEENVAEQGRNALTNQWQQLQSYVTRQKRNYLFHLAGVLALAAGLIWLRRQTRQWTGSDPNLLAATRVFQTPIATAITVSMILTPWIYQGAPRLFWGVLGTAALVPTILVLRPLIERSLRPLLYGLAGATFVSLLIAIAAAMPLVSRLLFLTQMGGAALFFIWFLRSGKAVPPDADGNGGKPALRKAAVIGARFGLAVTVFAFAANVFGYVSLSRLVGGALLTSAYLGVLLDTSVHVLDALLLGASHIQPLSTLGMIQRHRPLLLKRLHVLLCVLAVGLWTFFTLDALSIRTAVIERAEAVWAFPKSVEEAFPTPTARQKIEEAKQQALEEGDGDATTQPASANAASNDGNAPAADWSATVDAKKKPDESWSFDVVVKPPPNPQAIADKTADAKAEAKAAAEKAKAEADADASGTKAITSSLYVGGIILFILTLTAAYYLSRFIAFLLDEDVYPRLHLARGIPYAISTLLRYVVLAIGFTLAISNLGYNTTNLTILASAFSIGLGFGLQNIVNNFVSGLILLFERPVQVGDVIELDNVTGVVSRIGIRASVIRTPLAAEIIVPNGRLISDRVVNWTLSNRQRGIELPVTVAAGSDPQQLIKLLAATAKAHPLVASYPPPQAYFTEFAGGGMKFEVRAWTNRFEDWATVRSEVAVAINAALLKENIQLKG